MVVHSPDKFEVQRAAQAQASAAATAAQLQAARQAAEPQASGGVPPSVLGAGTASPDLASEEADLLGGDEVADFDAWDGDKPPARTHIEVHAASEQDVSSNVTIRRHKRATGLTNEEDKISLADSVADDLPPPVRDGAGAGAGPGALPQLNPFTPEWFAQLVGAAATAAATAVATANQKAPAPAPLNPAAPRSLNDRKVPDFWEDRPEFWFRIFDAHLFHFKPS